MFVFVPLVLLLSLCLPGALVFVQARLPLLRSDEAGKVIEGKQGFYFFAGEAQSQRESQLGEPPYDEATLRAWKELLEARRDYLAQRGIGYLFVAAPDKQSIYPEYLPAGVLPPRRFGQLLDHLKEHSTVPVLDLRESLLAAKPRYRVYQHTDTHWSVDGGFVTYQALVRKLAEQRPALGLVPVGEEKWLRRSADRPGGDLVRMLGRPEILEKDYGWLEPIPPLFLIHPRTDPALLEKKWPPNTEPQRVDNSDPAARGTALFFRDSFAGSWMYFLGQNFAHSFYIWQYHFDRDLIERVHPDVVVDEILERFISTQDPRKLRKQDGL